MNVINFKFPFLTFPAGPPIFRREIQLNSLKISRDLSCCGNRKQFISTHTDKSHVWQFTETFLLKPLAENLLTPLPKHLLTPLAEHIHLLCAKDRIGQCFVLRSASVTTWVAAAGGENRVLSEILVSKRDEVTGDWSKLYSKELNDLYCSPNIVRVIKPRRIWWAGHVTRMGRRRYN
jgi:hypothetical protein